ncbi:hypothetical protein [Microbacterium testaceum]|uniref:hypothetical protein n=1 Tax=Microbacterium testaceum TaxID=2033 RepID=UPI002AC6231A|nr:hypothetical protein [Microbacterium testaceum]MDZ5146140.1 hypothetical protein [Microbacterium testaceum]
MIMDADTTTVEGRRSLGRPSRRWRIWIIATAAMISIAIAVIAWAFAAGLWGAQARSEDLGVTVGQPKFLSETELRGYGASHAPVYWAGPMEDVNYEITEASSGSTFVRYVPKSESAGSQEEFLTVATYPEQQGFKRLQDASAEQDMGSQTTKSNALVVVNPNAPLSTYFSFPDASFQVEVFSPTPDESKQMVLDGAIRLLEN